MSDHASTSERRPLFAAIAAGDQAGVRAALDAGASAVAPNPQGDPPLLKAIVVGDLGIVRLLLAAGADPNQPGASGEPPLTLAARIDAPALQWLAQRGGTVKEDRFAPLLEALIQHGADLRAAGPEAARYGVLNACLPVLQTLDRLGLAWTEPDPGAGGPAPALAASLLALAVHQRTKVEIVRFLGQRPGSGVRGPGGGALVRCWAERPGDLDLQTLDALLAAGAAADLPDETGMTPLMLAAARGSAPACERLLAAGADDAARDREGRTALDHAAAAEDFSALAVLRGRREGGEFQAGQAATFAIDQRIVCQPWGTPAVLRVEGSADSLAAALAFVEERWSWSRPRIGPFPVLRVVYADGAERAANPRAEQAATLVRVGDFLLLTLLAARSSGRRNRWAPEEPQGERLVVAARFPSRAQALAAGGTARGWSAVVEVEALPQLEDGYPSSADAWHCDRFPGGTSGGR